MACDGHGTFRRLTLDRKTIGRSLARIVFISVKIWWSNQPSWHKRRASNLLSRF